MAAGCAGCFTESPTGRCAESIAAESATEFTKSNGRRINLKNPTEYLKYQYTDAEIADAARDLASANRKRASLEQRKKEVDSAIKAEIEAENSVIARLSSLIGTGYEYRDIEVRIELDTPEPGKKRVVRLDTGEEVAVKVMTDHDRQMVIDLQTAAEAEESAKREQEAKDKEPIVTPAPVLKGIEAPGEPPAPEVVSGATLAAATAVGGTHQAKGKRKRDRDAEAIADGSAE